MNKVVLTGRLCADPDFRQTQSGVASCVFRLAVNRSVKDKQTGNYEADFISCTAWRGTAEFISRYFQKGDPIAVTGTLRNNDWTDKDGTKHYSMNVIVDTAEFFGRRSENSPESVQNAAGQPQASSPQTYQAVPQTAHRGAQNANNAMLGDLGDFEEILGDGDCPF